MPSLILRLLLVVSLLVNGVGNAVAAVAMPGVMAGSSHAAMTMHDPELQTVGACEPVAGDLSVSTWRHPAAPTETHPADCDQDCCAQGGCSCACMQLAHAALLVVPVATAQLGEIHLAGIFPAGHVTPALLDPIRPPIG